VPASSAAAAAESFRILMSFSSRFSKTKLPNQARDKLAIAQTFLCRKTLTHRFVLVLSSAAARPRAALSHSFVVHPR
jgi:hypothetical protein